MSNIQDYFIRNKFNEYQMRDFLAASEDLQSRYGVDDEWLYTALTLKSPQDWKQYGFGLMFKEQFRNWVSDKVNSKKIEKKYDSMDNITDVFNQRFGGK